MHIVIANGDSDAAYIIDMFNTKENRLTVINGSKVVAQTLMERKHIAVTIGDPWHNAILEAARVYDADIFISLCKKDTDNFASCLMAKRNFHIKKCICAVSNPSNVDLYKKLGIDVVISSTYLLAKSIKNESNAESLIKSLSLDNEKIVMIEATLLPKYWICDQAIKDMGFPKNASIAYVVRNYNFIIPNGDLVLRPMDTIVVACAKENEVEILRFLKRQKTTTEDKVVPTPAEAPEEKKSLRKKKQD
ncbi:MAG: NAD-binding protein [Bacilli bacterium]|nr:NAD-binding protein [Bacilli bacterium]